jgi:hypothetical protein
MDELLAWEQAAGLSNRDEPRTELSRDGRAENETTRFDPGDLRNGLISIRVGERSEHSREDPPVRERPPNVCMTTDPRDVLNELTREIRRHDEKHMRR